MGLGALLWTVGLAAAGDAGWCAQASDVGVQLGLRRGGTLIVLARGQARSALAASQDLRLTRDGERPVELWIQQRGSSPEVAHVAAAPDDARLELSGAYVLQGLGAAGWVDVGAVWLRALEDDGAVPCMLATPHPDAVGRDLDGDWRGTSHTRISIVDVDWWPNHWGSVQMERGPDQDGLATFSWTEHSRTCSLGAWRSGDQLLGVRSCGQPWGFVALPEVQERADRGAEWHGRVQLVAPDDSRAGLIVAHGDHGDLDTLQVRAEGSEPVPLRILAVARAPALTYVLYQGTLPVAGSTGLTLERRAADGWVQVGREALWPVREPDLYQPRSDPTALEPAQGLAALQGTWAGHCRASGEHTLVILGSEARWDERPAPLVWDRTRGTVTLRQDLGPLYEGLSLTPHGRVLVGFYELLEGSDGSWSERCLFEPSD